MKVELIACSQPVNELPQNVLFNPCMISEQCASVCYGSKPTNDFKIFKNCMASGHCYDDETEILTEHGFKKFSELLENEKVATVNPNNRDFIGFEVPSEIIVRDYEGEMVCADSRHIDMCVTPNHNLYTSISKNCYHRTHPTFQLHKANEILPTNKMVWESPIRMCTCSKNPKNGEYYKDIELYSLFGFFIGDGYAEKDTLTSKKIRFHLKRQRKIDYLYRICDAIGLQIELKANNVYVVNLNKYDTKTFRKMFYTESGDKTFPDSFLEMSKKEFNYFLDGLLNSDGHMRSIENDYGYSTTSKILADKIQALACINHFTCSIRKKIHEIDTQKPTYYLQLHKNPKKFMPMMNDSRTLRSKLFLRHYVGKIYCCTVSTGLLIVRRNNKTMLCGNSSVSEHISFTFHIEGIDRAVLAQLSRHRHISLSVVSQRYVPFDNFQYTTPPTFTEEDRQSYDNLMKSISKEYQLLVNNMAPKEDARAVLPNSCYVELYMTANARTLIEISHLRLCSRAQHGIRTMFWRIKDEVSRVCPEVAQYMVPSCESHEIPFCEESKSCGKHPSLKAILKSKDDDIEMLADKIEELQDKIDQLQDDISRERDYGDDLRL